MQIQNLASITKNIPNSPPHFRLICHIPMNAGVYFIRHNAEFSEITRIPTKCGQSFQCFDAWNVEKYRCPLKGKWLADFIAHAHDLQLDIAKLDFDAKLSEKGLLVMDMDLRRFKLNALMRSLNWPARVN